jgi:hypothetical protein
MEHHELRFVEVPTYCELSHRSKPFAAHVQRATLFECDCVVDDRKFDGVRTI